MSPVDSAMASPPLSTYWGVPAPNPPGLCHNQAPVVDVVRHDLGLGHTEAVEDSDRYLG